MRLQRLTKYALFLSIALIFSYVEACIPLPVFLPGMKLGLANIVTIFILFRMRLRDAAAVSVARVLLAALLFGNVYSLAYSAAGAVCSLCGMALLRRWFGVCGVSVCGGILHNLAQLAVAAALVQTGAIFAYLPFLLAVGTLAGICIGLLAGVCIQRLPNSFTN